MIKDKYEILKLVKKFNKEESYNRIKRFIKQKIIEANVNGAALGVSGGVDSALTLKLTVDALGSEKVHVLMMPHSRITPSEDVDDAYELCNALGVKNIYEFDMQDLLANFVEALENKGIQVERFTYGNMLARSRMLLLYTIANSKNLLVIGTGDKSELLIGYFTKYGDGGVDILPIGDLYKTRVRELAKYLGIPDKITYKPSSPRLWEDQMAEEELGVSYDDVDVILYSFIDLKMMIDDIFSIEGINPDHVKLVINRVVSTEHKRLTPPIPKLFGGMTIGIDWRMPYHYDLNI